MKKIRKIKIQKVELFIQQGNQSKKKIKKKKIKKKQKKVNKKKKKRIKQNN